MKIKPDYQFAALPEETFREEMALVSEQLNLCRKEGTFPGFDGKLLHYEYFQAENSRGAIVVVHGLSEFTGKYHEFAWYMLKQGYDVFLYDQRCHGKSCRLTDRNDLIHVDRFTDYREDLHRFVRDVVRPVTRGPLYALGHSMGGAVVTQYLLKYKRVFKKAVLSAPMFQPLTGKVPAPVARWGLNLYMLSGNGKKQWWMSAEYDPDFPFERSHDQSRARFQKNMDLRHENPCYCTTPQTFRWIQQSLNLRGKLTSKRALQGLRTPILMLSPENDNVVSNPAQLVFAQNCPNCRHEVLPGASHGVFCGTTQTIAQMALLVLDHFA